MRLANKSALVVGGTSGIGLRTARRFLNEGAAVAITGRDPGPLQAAVETLGGTARRVLADLRDVASLNALARDVQGWSGHLDVLFVNTGVSRPGPLGAVDEAFFDDHITNLRGPFFVVQALLPLLRQGSSVVLTTSCLNAMGQPGMAVSTLARPRPGKLAVPGRSPRHP